MAALTNAQATVVYQAGQADKIILVALRDVSSGDTLDIGPGAIGALSVVNRAVVVGVTSFVEIAATWNGTVLTMPTGLASDAAYLLAWGSGTG